MFDLPALFGPTSAQSGPGFRLTYSIERKFSTSTRTRRIMALTVAGVPAGILIAELRPRRLDSVASVFPRRRPWRTPVR
jgi:hypothetical protein